MGVTLKGIGEEYTKEEIEGNRTAWIEALTSGEYKQTSSRLHRIGGGYCCLGVACEVLGVEGVEGVEVGGLGNERIKSYDGDPAYAPHRVTAALGLHTPDGAYYNDKGGQISSLARDNDNGKSFLDIVEILNSGKAWK